VFSRVEFTPGSRTPDQPTPSGEFGKVRGFAGLENTLVNLSTQPLFFNVKNITNLCLLPILRVYSNKDRGYSGFLMSSQGALSVLFCFVQPDLKLDS
jgi:hypothetical protein